MQGNNKMDNLAKLQDLSLMWMMEYAEFPDKPLPDRFLEFIKENGEDNTLKMLKDNRWYVKSMNRLFKIEQEETKR